MADVLKEVIVADRKARGDQEFNMTAVSVKAANSLHVALVAVSDEDHVACARCIVVRDPVAVGTAAERQILDTVADDWAGRVPRLRLLTASPVRHVEAGGNGDVRAAGADVAGSRVPIAARHA